MTTENPNTSDGLPLSDVRVLELGHIVAAPYATLILSDLGADVVKVEAPGNGDHMRVAGRTGQAIFHTLNRDKRSVTLDFRSEQGRTELKQLAAEADVIVENFSPGTMESFDLGYETLQASNPELIYANIKGFADGPYADRPATDPIAEAMGGLMHMTGHPDGKPARAGTSVADMAAASNAVIAIIAALRSRDRGGGGQYITVPIFEATVFLMGYWMAYLDLFDQEPQRRGASHSLYAPYNIYPTNDGDYVFIAGTNDTHWETIKRLFGLSLDYDDRETRLQNRADIDAAIEQETRQHERDDIVSMLLDNEVPCAPVNNIADVATDPHLHSAGALTQIDSITGEPRSLSVPLFPVWSDAYSVQGTAAPPQLGEHGDGATTEWLQDTED